MADVKQGVDLSQRLALTVPEAAAAVGVSERHLRSILPELPHCRIGGRVVIPVAALAGWLQARTRQEQGRVDAAVEEIMGTLE